MRSYIHINWRDFMRGKDEFWERYYKNLVNFTKWACLLLQREAALKLKPWNPETGEGGLDRGTLRRSITFDVKTTKETIEGKVGPTVKYAKFVEFGTRPHFIPFSHPLIGFEIYLWAKRHKLPVDNMWGLNISGRPHPFMTPAWNENKEKIFEQLKKIAKL